MAALASVTVCGLVALAAASSGHLAAQTQLRVAAKSHGDELVKGFAFNHRLRICNAYPFEGALDVYRGPGDKLTGANPMPYKECRDFLTPLKAGDRIEFKVGDAQAGTFSISDLPNNDAVLLLVIRRHDRESTAVSFESHVFANLLNAQIAVIDTYQGTARAKTKILDFANGGTVGSRTEDLRFDSVVAVNQGLYEVDLEGDDGVVKAKSALVALNRESYIILRTGVEAETGTSYPQALVIYPHSPVDQLPHSSAQAKSVAVVAVSLLAAMLTTLA